MSERPRVLVVDDELGPRESLRMILKPAYEIETVDSGAAALEVVGAFRPDVVYMDIKMPHMDGIELLRRIKRIDPSIEVVMITAYASLDTVKNALTHGAFEYLIKPFSRRDLEETARRAVARRQAELGTRSQLATLVEEMRSLAAKTRGLEEEARREQAELHLRVTQLSILREISQGILGQLDLAQLVAAISAQLRDALGYDEVGVHLGPTPPESAAVRASIVCSIVDDGTTLGYLIAANRAGARPIDPRERELLEMLSEYLAVAIRNSRLYGENEEKKQSLEQIITSAGDAIISVDRAGTIQSWNPAAERIFGLARAQALGSPLATLLTEDPYAEQCAALARGDSVPPFPITFKREDGRTLSLDVTLSSLPGQNGALEGMLAIIRDTTAQKELEAQMHQSEKLTALGQMAGGIAHDFNNLLQAILGYAQLMGKNPCNADVVRRGLQVIEKAATGGAETVRRIQKFARVRPEEPFVAVDLVQVITDALAMTHPRWEEKRLKAGVPLELEVDLKAVPIVMGRPAELNEVVTNLILNAIDAMPHGGTLRLRTRSQNRHVIFTVADSGIGMTEAVRRRIFDPFFTTKGEEGTGLGLPVSYSIVKRHGGDIGVESRVGGGSTFTVVLPIGTTPDSGSPADAGSGAQRTGRVLLVDNDPQVMDILGEMLKDAGHQVTAVRSGAEALEQFAPGAFDVVITNIGMVGMSGWELVEHLRARDSDVPIMFITGWGMHEQDQARCRGLGIFSLLFKPVRPAELYATVQSALAERDVRTSALGVPC
jgi:PAS domain S-box-containing protein